MGVAMAGRARTVMSAVAVAVFVATVAFIVATQYGSMWVVYPVVWYAHAKWVVRRYPIPIRDSRTGLYAHKRYWGVLGVILFLVGLWTGYSVVVVTGSVVIVAAMLHNVTRLEISLFAGMACTGVPVAMWMVSPLVFSIGSQLVVVWVLWELFVNGKESDRFSTVTSITAAPIRDGVPTVSQTVALVVVTIYAATLPVLVGYGSIVTRCLVLVTAQVLCGVPGLFSDNLYGPMLLFVSWTAIGTALVSPTLALPPWTVVAGGAIGLATYMFLVRAPSMDARLAVLVSTVPIGLACVAMVHRREVAAPLAILSFVPLWIIVANLCVRVVHRPSIHMAWPVVMWSYSYVVAASVLVDYPLPFM